MRVTWNHGEIIYDEINRGDFHFANLLSYRSVKDSFNRKLTTIAKRKTATM